MKKVKKRGRPRSMIEREAPAYRHTNRKPHRKGRTRAMIRVIEALRERGRSLSWLADELRYSRQAVSGWNAVPGELVEQVSALSGLSLEEVNPDYVRECQRTVAHNNKYRSATC